MGPVKVGGRQAQEEARLAPNVALFDQQCYVRHANAYRGQWPRMRVCVGHFRREGYHERTQGDGTERLPLMEGQDAEFARPDGSPTHLELNRESFFVSDL